MTVGFAETEYTILASEGAVNVTVMIAEGEVDQEPCIQLDLQTGELNAHYRCTLGSTSHAQTASAKSDRTMCLLLSHRYPRSYAISSDDM